MLKFFFFLTNYPKPEEIKFTKLLTFEKLVPDNG